MDFFKTLLVGGALALSATSSHAATVYTGDNDCAGLFGKSFDECAYEGSPIIYKDNVEQGEADQINPIFPSIDGSEFSWDYDEGTSFSGTWTYILGEDDPLVTAVVAKGGNGFVVFELGVDFEGIVDGMQTGSWYTTEGGLSHLSWYDTGVPPIPLPAAGWLLLGGLGGLAAMKRRRKS